MYETDGPMEHSIGKECTPDYEAMAAKVQKEIKVFTDFKDSLLNFIDCIGRHAIKREPGTLTELLGKLELDLIEKHKTHASLLEKIEKG